MLKNYVMKERWEEDVEKQEGGMEGNKEWMEGEREGKKEKRVRRTDGRKLTYNRPPAEDVCSILANQNGKCLPRA